MVPSLAEKAGPRHPCGAPGALTLGPSSPWGRPAPRSGLYRVRGAVVGSLLGQGHRANIGRRQEALGWWGGAGVAPGQAGLSAGTGQNTEMGDPH